ncbi:hypothetical protein AD933_10610 [Acetobacter malorum]|uniref:Uncharacterized protein n=1 Tax=Acetobacter malorum TaxID=178901 RepID=A0A149RL62_9PROT|nr:hypothetical protein AD933_10610 [Acetobacter malorum]
MLSSARFTPFLHKTIFIPSGLPAWVCASFVLRLAQHFCGFLAGVRAEEQRSLRFRKTRRSHFPVHELLQPFFRGDGLRKNTIWTPPFDERFEQG